MTHRNPVLKKNALCWINWRKSSVQTDDPLHFHQRLALGSVDMDSLRQALVKVKRIVSLYT